MNKDEIKEGIKGVGIYYAILIIMYIIFMAIVNVIANWEDVCDWVKSKLPKKKSRFNARGEVYEKDIYEED